MIAHTALTIVFVEPKSGFEIAFDMFDIDGNKRVDIDEFKVVGSLHSLLSAFPFRS